MGKLMAANRTGHLLTCMRPIELPLYAISFRLKQRSLALRVKLGVFFSQVHMYHVGGSSPGKTAENRSARICENMRLCLLKKNNKTGGKTSVAIGFGVDLGRL